MKQSQSPGILGEIALVMMLLFASCNGSAAQPSEGYKPPECRDDTPHKQRFVTVAPGVKLEVLDWGGSGEAMVLLTGLGDNAHVYDQFAAQFTDYFHVIGITRRGYPPSSISQDGYDVQTRVSDDIAVLDALGIDKAVLVGHSLAASEMSALAETHQNRVDKLVYLDAYDLSRRNEFPGPPGPEPLYTEADAKSLWSYLAASARYEGIRRPDEAVCLAVQFDSNGALTGSSTPAFVPSALLAGVAAIPPVNWANIAAPRLGIFAQYSLKAKVPWYWYLSSADQALFDEQFPPIVKWAKDTIREFASGATTYLLPGQPHYIYINNETDVVREMRKFLGLPLRPIEGGPLRLREIERGDQY